MIDWVSCKLPLKAAETETRDGGHYLLLDPHGTIETDRPRPLPIMGSHDSRLHARTVGSFLYLQGNPCKWWQGHNLFGSNDLQALICSTAERVCQLLGLEVTATDRRTWWNGWIPLSRVDCTIMLQYESRADVRAVLRSASKYAYSRHGAATTRGSTVYLGLASRRWTLKLYSKGDELEAISQKHHLPDSILHREELTQYADSALRVELQLRGLELSRRDRALSCCWNQETPLAALQEKLETITMPSIHRLPSTELEDLPGRLIAVYEAWRAGHDIRAIYSRSTYYRYRKELLLYGIDIQSTPAPQPQEEPNIVPLNRVLDGQLSLIPEWAEDTPLYFQPPLPGPALKVVNQ